MPPTRPIRAPGLRAAPFSAVGLGLAGLVLLAAAPSGSPRLEFRPEGVGEAPFTPCIIPPAPKKAAAKEEPTPETYPSAWARFDLAPDAPNSGLAPELLKKIRDPLDLGALPDQPLHGAPADVARVRAVFANAKSKVQRIALWGDSHTGVERLQPPLRHLLQGRYGNAGVGYVMAGGVGKLNQVGQVHLCEQGVWKLASVAGKTPGPLGPAGFASTASTPDARLWIDIQDEPHGDGRMRASVLYFQGPEGGSFRVEVDRAAPIVVSTRGVSTPATAVFDLTRANHRLALAPAGDGAVRLAGFSVERDAPGEGGVVIDGLGAGNRPFSAWNQWDMASMTTWVASRPYDLWILVAGSADARNDGLTEEKFRTNLRESLTRVRSLGPEVACVVVGPGDRAVHLGDQRYVLWESHPWVNRVVQEEGSKAGCATWDLQAQMGGLGASAAWYQSGLMSADFTHLTADGYQEVARRLVQQIDPR